MLVRFLSVLLLATAFCFSQEATVVKKWTDQLLFTAAQDGQGPTIQIRNMFHTLGGIYDAWAAYDNKEKTYFLGQNKAGKVIPFNANFFNKNQNIDSLRNIAINYTAYRILYSHYSEYGSKGRTIDPMIDLFESLGGDINYHDTDYMNGKPESLGNYIAAQIIEYGFNDGSREDDRFENYHYFKVNEDMRPDLPGVQQLNDPNRWQAINIDPYLDIKGPDHSLTPWNRLLVRGNGDFLTPYWGEVIPFALNEKDKEVKTSDNGTYNLYFDPGQPSLFNLDDPISSEAYKWGFGLVLDWSSYMDSDQKELWDISPKGITENYIPKTLDEFKAYYNIVGNNLNRKKNKNPVTGNYYQKNIVKKSDYIRTIAEFWVDAVNTPSPPGHWLQFLVNISYKEGFKRKWRGKGKSLNQLEWDAKSFFFLSGTLHDAAIACWSAKGYYDYVRPITAIRYLGGLGQSSDKNLPNYHPNGLTLIPNKIALVKANDPLVGDKKEHLHKIKVMAWRGPEAIEDTEKDTAGVGWILAENWWPYQRYSFTTPPFAGYVSGHSTFSLAGAEILTYITGSPYFYGGLETFTAEKNTFLEFENGPSETVTLQWATYYDAAIETCLSRVWGGIHPPIDDIRGRELGQKVARNAISFAEKFFK